MKVDTIKATATYAAALVILIGGFTLLYATRLDPPEARGPMQLMIAGFMGSAITFLFVAEGASRATHAATAATAAGVASMPTTTVTAGPPATATTTAATAPAVGGGDIADDDEEPLGDAI